jgi:hypothetical protein
MNTGKDYFTEEEIEGDLYFDEALARLNEDGELSGFEEGFMHGYLSAY